MYIRLGGIYQNKNIMMLQPNNEGWGMNINGFDNVMTYSVSVVRVTGRRGLLRDDASKSNQSRGLSLS